jgi:hypothetical protein
LSSLFCLAKIWWRPGIGDPYPLAWAITVTYFVSAALCIWAGRRERRATRLPHYKAASLAPAFWFVMAGLMFAMGCNKQLDLQTLILQLEGEAIRFAGFRGEHRSLEMAFVVAYVAIGGACLAAGLRVMRHRLRRYGLAFIGLACLLTFVIVRAAFFHRFDPLLYRVIRPAWVNATLELGGTIVVGLAALIAGGNACRTPEPKETPDVV